MGRGKGAKARKLEEKNLKESVQGEERKEKNPEDLC